MKRKIYFGLWLFLTIIIYGWTEYTVAQDKNFEASIAFTAYLCILTFPIGLIVPVFWMLVTYLFNGTITGLFLEDGHFINFLFWISFVALGYWQWFVFIPKLITKWTNHRKISN